MNVVEGLLNGLVWAVVPTALVIIGLWWVDKHEKEPIPLLLLALVAGVIAAPLIAWALAVLTNQPLAPSSSDFIVVGSYSIVRPIIEAVAKDIVILVLFFAIGYEFDDTLDGVIYGALVGVGYALTINFRYLYDVAANPLFSTGGPGADVFLRVAYGGLNQAFYSALFGAGLGYLKTLPVNQRLSRVWVPVVAFLLGLGAHILHDYLVVWGNDLSQRGALTPGNSWLWGLLILASDFLGLVGLGLIVTWVWGKEALIIRDYLRDEVASGVVTPDDYETLGSSLKRLSKQTGALARGLGYYSTLRRLYYNEVELAFRKWHLSKGEPLKASQKDTSEEGYRAAIVELRSRLQAYQGGAKSTTSP